MNHRYQKIITYFVLIMFCAQAAMAGIDVHSLEKSAGPIDIVHHYIDSHGKPNGCDTDKSHSFSNDSFSSIDISNDNLTEYHTSGHTASGHEVSEHTDSSHHGCSGHVVSLDYDHLTPVNPRYIPTNATFRYFSRTYLFDPLPINRPPIL